MATAVRNLLPYTLVAVRHSKGIVFGDSSRVTFPLRCRDWLACQALGKERTGEINILIPPLNYRGSAYRGSALLCGAVRDKHMLGGRSQPGTSQRNKNVAVSPPAS